MSLYRPKRADRERRPLLTQKPRPALGKTHKTSVKIAVLTHGLPNYFFHLNAGYQILRGKGVPVGKKDYLSSFLPF